MQKRTTFSLKKINIEENIPIKNKISDLFNNPHTYFVCKAGENEVIIGKKQRFPRFNKNGAILPYCYVGEIGKQGKKSMISINESKINQSFRTFYLQNPQQKGKSSNKNYHVINDCQLGDLFEGYKKRIQSNQKRHNRFISDTPKIKGVTLQKILLQEKVLVNKEKINDKALKFEEAIASKVKKPVNALLMNSVSNNTFRMKQETIKAANKSNHRFTMNDWMKSLRDEEGINGKRYCYVKGRNQYAPIYGLEVQHLTEDNELVRDPEYDYMSTLKSNEYLRTSQGFNKIVATTQAFRNLVVKGKNLLQVEYDSAKTIKGNKRLLKRNEEDNNKTESYIEDWK